jgi:hypothetical protein
MPVSEINSITPSINPPFDQPVKSALVFSAFSMPRINALRGYVIENKLRPIFLGGRLDPANEGRLKTGQRKTVFAAHRVA